MQTFVYLSDSTGCRHLGGLPTWERQLRTLRQLDVGSVSLLVDSALDRDQLAPRRPDALENAIWLDPQGLSAPVLLGKMSQGEETVMVVPAEYIFDARIPAALSTLKAPTAVVDTDPPSEQAALLAGAPIIEGRHLCGPVLVTRKWLSTKAHSFSEHVREGLLDLTIDQLDVAQMPVYSSSLRREFRPFWFPSPAEEQEPTARDLLLASTQKGSLDVPAYFHAPIEKFWAWRLSETRWTANQITVVTNIAALSATAFFAYGRLGLGLAIALAVGVLDGIDGKLARLRLETSRLGELEHWFDFLYEWSWWTALAYYFSSSGRLPGAWKLLGLLAFAEALDGLAKWAVIRRFGCTIDEMGAFEKTVRLVGGRRNIYIWILTLGALLGRSATAYAVLPWWQLATATLHWLRLPALYRRGEHPALRLGDRP